MPVNEKDISRINKSAKNAAVALFTSILMGVLSFLERTQFNHVYIDDYLGLFSFFNNVINILSCSELGITTAVGYALYKPVAYNDKVQISAIMNFMKKVYWAIGGLIFAGGMLLLPFLPYMITTEIAYSNVCVYFMIFVLKTSFTYWLTYSVIIVAVNQEQYIQTFIQNMVWCVQYVLLMVVSALTGDFLLYSITMLACSIVCSVLLKYVSHKRYPIKKTKEKLPKEARHAIFNNTKGLVLTKIGSVAVNSTDSILISIMVSTAFLGRYANYQMIIAGIQGVMGIIPNAISASIGNVGVTESKRKLSRSFETIDLAHYFIYSTIAIILLCSINPIVATFFGVSKILPFSSVIIICINFYIHCLRFLTTTYKSSLGLYWHDRKRPLFEAVANIVFSIILGHFWGFNGIMIGTILTNIVVNLWYEPLIIYHHGFSNSAYWHYFTLIGRALLSFIIGICALLCTIWIPQEGILSILVRIVLSFFVAVLIYGIIYRNNNTAILIFNVLKNLMISKIKKNN